uniref:general secretion pathway protein GspB n=1 Tax=Pseudoduganella sp. OTU4001 TaxID=3043854 RepID=UPI00313C42B4
ASSTAVAVRSPAPTVAAATRPAALDSASGASAAPKRAADVPVASQPTAAVPAAPPEEHLQSLQDLPEPIQRAIPQIALGGYMYSKNPADRLLLIDKVLRKEGEEVAPGLLLEKLQPKQAVFSFRGYRYRVPL